MKVVINTCFGGFSLSDEACELYLTKKGFNFTKEPDKWGSFNYRVDGELWYAPFDVERNDPTLVEVVEELGEKADGSCASLKVVEIPDGISWEISEYDGAEHIAETHRTWG